jgi:peptide deformylase
MTKDDIISLPNPHLRERSRKVGLIDEQIKQLIRDMQAATLDWEASRSHEVGVALAAVQIDQLYRVVVVRNDFDNKADRTFTTLINPVITKYEGEIIEDFEGCLSVPDIYGKVPRYQKVRVKALNEHGREVRITAEDFLARLLQHEIDHTNGKVFVDHIRDHHNAFYKLTPEGKLIQLNYETDVEKLSSILW